ncbi:hypothetical protein FHS16_003338 [Paenibacillus endophyticus]|uniref:Uncharacterized protein n=1 Tax=Paenibacillus endophyticus TaxID=1294268 RepID=A0A7W5C8W7_9BACL|nr:hypothetical protein [Paenibacillus endophyticus]
MVKRMLEPLKRSVTGFGADAEPRGFVQLNPACSK